jgi:nitroreductase
MQERLTLKRLKDRNFNLFYNTPILILVIGNAPTDYDCSMCAGIMILVAHSLGIGSCWIGGSQQSEEIMAELKINYKTPIIFGHPKTDPPIPEKREPAVFWLH